MNRTDLLDYYNQVVVTLGRTLLDVLWQGAVIAALYALLRVLLRTPRAREAVGHLAMLALAVAPVITFVQRWSGAAAVESVGGLAVETVTVATNATAAASDTAQGSEWWLAVLVMAWIAGVALLCLRQAIQWRQLHRLCDQAQAMGPAWTERFEQLKHRLGVRIRVRLKQSAQVAVPMLVGVVRPIIVIPVGLMTRLPQDQLELILLHELAHLRRLDPFFNLLQTAIETLLFYHPAVHWISRNLREDRELCCDDIVVNEGADRLRYARILLSLAEADARPAPSMTLAASGGVLMQRIERIVAVPSSPQPLLRGLAPVVGVVLLTFALLLPLLREPLPESIEAPLSPSLGAGLGSLAMPALELVVGDLVARLDAPEMSPLTPSDAQDAAAGAITEGSSPSVSTMMEPPLSIDIPLPEAPAAAAALLMALPVVESEFKLTANSSIQVQGVEVAAPLDPAQAAPDSVEPLLRVAPEYPVDARRRGLEGSVTLRYQIGADGRVTEIEVEDAQASTEFESAARDALRQWRFDPSAADGQPLKVQFDFVLGKPDSEDVHRGCERLTGSRLCRQSQDTSLRVVQMQR